MLLKDLLVPKLLNNPFASCSFTNLDFVFPHSVHLDCIINLPFFVLKIFRFKFSLFSYALSNKFSCSFITSVGKKLKINF